MSHNTDVSAKVGSTADRGARRWLPGWMQGSSTPVKLDSQDVGAKLTDDSSLAGASTTAGLLPQLAPAAAQVHHAMAPATATASVSTRDAGVELSERAAPSSCCEIQPAASLPDGTSDLAALVAAAQDADEFSDLDALGFLVTEGVRDKAGRAVIVVVARNVPVRVLQLDRLHRYVTARWGAVAMRGTYSVVWMHTRATYRDNCPSLAWIWRTYERLPSEFRSNLSRLYVLHCDMSMWLTMAAMLPWFSTSLWGKVEWCPRIEFLHDHIDKRVLPVPAFVAEHDGDLEEQPLADYGLLAVKESTTLLGLPGPMLA